MTPKIVIITGHVATGKTTLGIKLAAALQLPFYSKDALKEILYDTLGWSDREWSKKAGASAFRLLDHITTQELAAGRSAIVEANFLPQFDSTRFSAWQADYKAHYLQIRCSANKEVLIERLKSRSLGDERHPGHNDASDYEEFIPAFQAGDMGFLDLEGPKINLDTTDFAKVDFAALLTQLYSFLNSVGAQHA